MAANPDQTDNPLGQQWPAFLDHLNTDPAKAEFAVFAYRLLKLRPPRILRDQNVEKQEDWTQEILMHFTANQCRVLRGYRNTGHPFASWFITVANRKACDLYRRDVRVEVHEIGQGLNTEYINAMDHSAQPDTKAVYRGILRRVQGCLQKMSHKCITLIKAAAEEYNPCEIEILLGADVGSNKKVSDDLRACRKRLRTLLKRDGVDVDRLFR